MKDKMGIHHSSFNCERLSTSLHNCFGIDSSPHQFESENDKKNPNSSPTSSNDNFVDVASVQPKKTITSKNRSSKETCCCPVANYDDFPYKACGPSPVSELNAKPQSASTCSSSVTQSTCARDRKSSDDSPSSYNTAEGVSQQAHSPLLSMSNHSVEQETSVEAHNKQLSSNSIIQGIEGEASNISGSKERLVSVGSASESNLKENKAIVVDSGVGNMNNAVSPLAIAASSKSNGINASQRIESDLVSKEDLNNASHFRNLVTSETSRLNDLISTWKDILLVGNSRCPAEVRDEIRTVIGQTKLVINERFSQFSKLIDRADGSGDSSSDQLPVLLSDLQGFWDMIYFQVQDVDAKFKSLDQMKANQWKSKNFSPSLSGKKVNSKTTLKTKTTAKKTPTKKKTTQTSEEDKKRREAARKRIADARKALASRNQLERDSPLVESQSNPQQSAIEDSKPIPPAENDNETTPRRPESIVDVITCAVAVTHANNDSTSLSSISSTGLVHG